jgi:hypothetical protein
MVWKGALPGLELGGPALTGTWDGPEECQNSQVVIVSTSCPVHHSNQRKVLRPLRWGMPSLDFGHPGKHGACWSHWGNLVTERTFGDSSRKVAVYERKQGSWLFNSQPVCLVYVSEVDVWALPEVRAWKNRAVETGPAWGKNLQWISFHCI